MKLVWVVQIVHGPGVSSFLSDATAFWICLGVITSIWILVSLFKFWIRYFSTLQRFAFWVLFLVLNVMYLLSGISDRQPFFFHFISNLMIPSIVYFARNVCTVPSLSFAASWWLVLYFGRVLKVWKLCSFKFLTQSKFTKKLEGKSPLINTTYIVGNHILFLQYFRCIV